MAEDDQRGRILKVLTATDAMPSDSTTSGNSQQLQLDSFKQYTHGIQEPVFSLENLVFLAESHPIHGAALEQKAADVVGTGYEWEKTKSVKASNEAQKDQLDDWLNSLVDENTDATLHEILLSAWGDLETVGHGAIEVARDLQGKVVHLYHVPAHTTRFHRDGIRVVQMRNGKRVWFKRWIPEDTHQVNRVTGALSDKPGEIPKDKLANEMFILRRPSRRSSWYGIPVYITAVGWVALSLAARDDNVLYFSNRREPRWAIILTNLDDDPEMEEDLRQAFAVDLKQPHKNIIVPISGPGKIDFKQLSDTKVDMSFERLQSRADACILVAHRMPGERLGAIASGPLGGNAVVGASRVYKEAVVQPNQQILSSRMNRFIKAESGVDNIQWKWKPEELDLTEESADVGNATALFGGGIITLDEARTKVGEPPLEEGDARGKMFITELANASQPALPPSGDAGNGGDPTGGGDAATLDAKIQAALGAGANGSG